MVLWLALMRMRTWFIIVKGSGMAELGNDEDEVWSFPRQRALRLVFILYSSSI